MSGNDHYIFLKNLSKGSRSYLSLHPYVDWIVFRTSCHRRWKTPAPSLKIVLTHLNVIDNVHKMLIVLKYSGFIHTPWTDLSVSFIWRQCSVVFLPALRPYALTVKDKKCWLLITRGWACGMFEANTFVLIADIKTYMWIRSDGCIITAMTSRPIDNTDGRQDSWQHGTKPVWAAVPSVVCCHDRGGSYYLHGCFPHLSRHRLARWWSVKGGGVSWKWKDGLIRAQPLPLLSFLCPLWWIDWVYWSILFHISQNTLL